MSLRAAATALARTGRAVAGHAVAGFARAACARAGCAVAGMVLAGSALAVIALAGCAPPTATDGRPSVVTTTDVYGAVAAAVAGDRATVHPIITSASADPHEYEATPADALAVSKAAVLVANGGGYDDFAGKLLAATGSHPAFIDVSALSRLPGSAGSPDFNEHVWYHLPTVAALAERLAGELVRMDPADAATFTANAAAFKATLTGLETRVRAIAAAHRGEPVVITEPVPGYLIEAAGLVDATPAAVSHAVENGTDAPAGVLEQTLRLLQDHRVRALLVNSQTQGATTEQLVRAAVGAGVPVVRVTETLPAGMTDYVTWMGDRIDRLAAALDQR